MRATFASNPRGCINQSASFYDLRGATARAWNGATRGARFRRDNCYAKISDQVVKRALSFSLHQLTADMQGRGAIPCSSDDLFDFYRDFYLLFSRLMCVSDFVKNLFFLRFYLVIETW